jgi:Aldo/keto reductase family
MRIRRHESPIPDKQEMISFVHAAVDRGITLLDTAEVYGPFANEELLGEAPQPSADRIEALRRLAVLSEDSGEDARGMKLCEQTLTAAEALGEPGVLVHTACPLASRLYRRDDVVRAELLATRSLGLCQGRSDMRGDAAPTTRSP